MKITTEVSPPSNEEPVSSFYEDTDPESEFYGKVYLLVAHDHLFAAVRIDAGNPAMMDTRSGWGHPTIEAAISGSGSRLARLTPILPPRTITIELS